jgi:Flp pilus assembly protein TadG
MSHRITSASLWKSWRRLFADDRANVTITFAVALVPLIALVGTAVDYSRASAIRTAMQTAADSTALAVAKNAASLTQKQVQDQAEALFKGSFASTGLTSLVITGTYSTEGGSTVTVSATGTMKTSFLGVMGISEMQLGTKAVSAWGNKRLRVALVLDTTGSMRSDGKIGALKTATNSLLDQLKAAATNPEDIYVSIIPFSKGINADSVTNLNATWIDWTDWEAEPPILAASKPSNWNYVGPGSDCPFPYEYSWYRKIYPDYGFGCASSPNDEDKSIDKAKDKIPNSGTYKGYICPTINTDDNSKYKYKNGVMYNGCYDSTPKPDKITTGSGASCYGKTDCKCTGSDSKKTCTQKFPNQYDHTWIPKARSTWNGCITDRGLAAGPSNDYDRLASAPGSAAASKFPAEQYANCSPIVQGLSREWATMKTLVNGLYPNGSTNQPIGLVWGWQSLAGGGPFTVPAKISGYDYQDVIILLSDGLNTQDRWYSDGSTTSTEVDSRMYDANHGGAGTCANVKAAKVLLYTIHVNTEGAPTSQLLKNCASTEDHFFTVTAANQIQTVFNEIGSNLSQLRIAK